MIKAKSIESDPIVPIVLIVGCGYVGARLGVREVNAGARVIASTRHQTRFKELRDLGLEPLALDLDADTLPDLAVVAGGARVFYLAPPTAQGSDDLRATRFLAALGEARPQCLVLISTTGVYGDAGGAWVDEDYPLNPTSDRARRRASAEQQFTQWAQARTVPLAILRVAGIYGPDKLPLARLREGVSVLAPGEAPYSNRVHVEDLVRACRAAAAKVAGMRVWNIADGTPGNMSDYFLRLADAFGLPRPAIVGREQAQTELTAGMRDYLRESRRIDNRRMREELTGPLLFPDLESGLRQLAPTARRDIRRTCVVCINRRLAEDAPSCAARGAEAIADRLQAEIAGRGIDADVKRVYCLGRCEQGPNVRIAPGGKSFAGVDTDGVEAVLAYLAEDQSRGG